jgi:hypothetical protein
MPSWPLLLLLLLSALACSPRARGLGFDSGKLPHNVDWSVNEHSTAHQVLLLNVEKAPATEKEHDGAAAISRLLILYYSRHFGTVQDFASVMRSLGTDVSWSHLSPGQFCSGYGAGVASVDECYGKLKHLCNVYDVIFVGDINSDGFPFVHGECKSWVVFQMTNRFDWDVGNPIYYTKLNESVNSNPRVLFMANNPLEVAYARSKGVHIPAEKYFLARPMGYTPFRGGRLAAAAARPPACWQMLQVAGAGGRRRAAGQCPVQGGWGG